MLKSIPTNDEVLLNISGRVFSEMLTKAAKEGIPIVVSISAHCKLLIFLVEALVIILIEFARSKVMNV